MKCYKLYVTIKLKNYILDKGKVMDNLEKVENIERTEIVEKKSTKICGKLTALKVLSLIFYIAIFVFLFWELIALINYPNSNDKGFAVIGYILLLLIFGVPGNIISSVLAIVGLITTLARREKGTKKGQVIFFAIMSVLPLITEVLLIVVAKFWA